VTLLVNTTVELRYSDKAVNILIGLDTGSLLRRALLHGVSYF